MDRKTFTLLAGVIFAIVALVHLLRIYMAWPVVIGDWTVPIWVSWIALVVAGGPHAASLMSNECAPNTSGLPPTPDMLLQRGESNLFFDRPRRRETAFRRRIGSSSLDRSPKQPQDQTP
jgi:hypothetical protein